MDELGVSRRVAGNPAPLLYARGEHEGGALAAYLAGFRAAGFSNVRGVLILDSGHFAPEEQPEAVWQAIAAFMNQ